MKVKPVNLKFPQTKPKFDCEILNKDLENLGLSIFPCHILMCADSTFAKCDAGGIGDKFWDSFPSRFQPLKSGYFPDEILLSNLIRENIFPTPVVGLACLCRWADNGDLPKRCMLRPSSSSGNRADNSRASRRGNKAVEEYA
ncbi:hypothetical protein [Calothrix sp. NIES-3974]|uniref:hypothetical protein n=1 Tax=Calothrix sp. NIES-3974 TaxID=2005462 RepID=UPI000B60A1FE|nr:hypothetical protein [Calothrix sp. NIES-3974]BAZ07154.1 hypothetical protein NIES3974_38170 [Calothrix sp. NIES-3974]